MKFHWRVCPRMTRMDANASESRDSFSLCGRNSRDSRDSRAKFKRWIIVLLVALAALGEGVSLVAQEQSEGLNAVVEVLKQSDDAQFQYDLLKGMSDGLKGRRGVAMPAGWEELTKKLAQSPNPQVRELAQSLSVTFGSATALT